MATKTQIETYCYPNVTFIIIANGEVGIQTKMQRFVLCSHNGGSKRRLDTIRALIRLREIRDILSLATYTSDIVDWIPTERRFL